MTLPHKTVRRHRKAQLQARLQHALETHHYPRAVMTAIVLMDGLFAFAASWGLYQLGVQHLALRYLLVWVLVYVLFVMMVRLWLSWQLSHERSAMDSLDIGELLPDIDANNSVPDSPPTNDYTGEGGEFGGGGAGGSWSVNKPTGSYSPHSSTIDKSSVNMSSGKNMDFGDLGGLDEAGLPLFVLLAILAVVAIMLGGLAWVGYSIIEAAPILLAELLADILIVNTLRRRLINSSQRESHWLKTIWRRTQRFFWIVIALIGVLFIIMLITQSDATTFTELFGQTP